MVVCSLIGIFILGSFMAWFTNLGRPLLLLWGARNTFRSLIYFIACIFFLDTDTIERLLKKINPLLVINFVLCLFESVMLGYAGDYVGGGFGVTQGCNAPLNALIVIATIYNAVQYTQKKQSLLKVIVYIGLCVGISGLAELKVYIVEIALIVLVVGAFSKGFIKKVFIVLIGIVFALMSIELIEKLMPSWEGFFTLENMYNMISSKKGYTNSGDLNRLTAVVSINEMFFKNSINWFGLGLGNCEFSDTIENLNSVFSMKYGYLHYGWFSVAKVYLELGWFGVISSISIWIYTFSVVIRKLRFNQEYRIIVACMTIMATFFFFYNSTMNLDAGYVIYTVLAIGYVSLNSVKKSINDL